EGPRRNLLGPAADRDRERSSPAIIESGNLACGGCGVRGLGGTRLSVSLRIGCGLGIGLVCQSRIYGGGEEFEDRRVAGSEGGRNVNRQRRSAKENDPEEPAGQHRRGVARCDTQFSPRNAAEGRSGGSIPRARRCASRDAEQGRSGETAEAVEILKKDQELIGETMRMAIAGIVAVMLAASAPASKAKDETPQFKTAEARHFTSAEGVELSPTFADYFYAELRSELVKGKFVTEVIGEGEAVEDADAANSLVITGTITEFKKGSVVKNAFIGFAGMRSLKMD